MEGRRAREKQTTKDLRAELKAYLLEDLLSIDEGASPERQGELILGWWKVQYFISLPLGVTCLFRAPQINAIRYPILSRMALDYLPIQGSSVPCERAFSDAGLTDTKRRAQLLPENFGDIQTVKGKYKKERRRQKAELAAQRAAQKKCWIEDSVQEVQGHASE